MTVCGVHELAIVHSNLYSPRKWKTTELGATDICHISRRLCVNQTRWYEILSTPPNSLIITKKAQQNYCKIISKLKVLK